MNPFKAISRMFHFGELETEAGERARVRFHNHRKQWDKTPSNTATTRQQVRAERRIHQKSLRFLNVSGLKIDPRKRGGIAR